MFVQMRLDSGPKFRDGPLGGKTELFTDINELSLLFVAQPAVPGDVRRR